MFTRFLRSGGITRAGAGWSLTTKVPVRRLTASHVATSLRPVLVPRVAATRITAAVAARWLSTAAAPKPLTNAQRSGKELPSDAAATAPGDSTAAANESAATESETTSAGGAAASPPSPSSGGKQKKRGHRKAQDIPSLTAEMKSGGGGLQAVMTTLTPGSLPPATAEELPAAETEGPFRCVAYEVGQAFDLEKLEQALHGSGYALTTFQGVLLVTYSPPAAPESGESAIKKVFFLREGEAVFWGTSAAEERRWLALARPHAADAVSEIGQMFTEDMPYYVGKDPHTPTQVHADSIILNGIDDEKSRTRQQLAFSMSLARSLQLDSVEEEMEDFLTILEPLPIDLAAEKLPPKKVWSKIVSKQLALRGRLNLHSGLLEIPDLYWHKPRYEEFYKSMEKNLDIPNRIAILNKRMDYTEHVTEVVRSELDSKRSHFAEWLIIILISLEIVAHLAEKWEWWRQFRWESIFTAAPTAKPTAAASAAAAPEKKH